MRAMRRDPGSIWTAGFTVMAAAAWRGTHVPSTRELPSGDRSDIAALRTIVGVPGRRSILVTLSGVVAGTGSTNSCVASNVPAGMRYGSAIATAREGGPAAQSFLKGGGTGVVALSPWGVPPVAQFNTISSSRAEI